MRCLSDAPSLETKPRIPVRLNAAGSALGRDGAAGSGGALRDGAAECASHADRVLLYLVDLVIGLEMSSSVTLLCVATERPEQSFSAIAC